MHIDSFTNASVVDLKKSMRHENGVLNALRINPTVSTFDMSANYLWLPSLIEQLIEKGFIVEIEREYPWHEYVITDDGLRQITI